MHRDIKSTDFTEPYSQKKASPPAPLRMERGVITEIPLYVLRRLNSPSPPITRPVGVTSHTTPLAIRRGAGGEASVISVCRRRSVSSKLCAKRVCQICEICERNTSPVSLAIVLFLTEYTEKQITQRCTETISQPISQNFTAIFGSYAL